MSGLFYAGFWKKMVHERKEREILFSQCIEGSDCEFVIEKELEVLSEVLNVMFMKNFRKNGVPRRLYPLSATAKGIMIGPDFV